MHHETQPVETEALYRLKINTTTKSIFPFKDVMATFVHPSVILEFANYRKLAKQCKAAS